MNADQVRAIFIELVAQVPPEQWDARLAELAGDDEEVRGKVAALLAAHRKADSFLERPAAPLAGTVDEPPAAAVPPARGAAPEETPGTVLAGRYKLVEAIGEGGMGTVWMAQQTAPVKRLVAVKLIKAGMDSKQVLARFAAERQALALMDHPNIARVFDAGTTESGRPYFVMELVKGVPLTAYCDQQRLTPRQRLELFVPVCQAIQHAHQKGVIHRDIKPSNVLVALYDGKPVPKVIDFGIAKATGPQLTDHTLVTGFGAMVGTLEYMSPEQAERNQLDIDTRSDVYALGVLLYELLTGTTPLHRKRLKQAAVLELLRIIREEEPQRPSTRLSESKESLPSISAQRQMEPAKLTRLVRGELDWIVMKALDKDRNRRYETANGFALEVQRYLSDEPVLACPPSVGYRFRKFARRNKGSLAVAAGLCLAVTVALVASVVAFFLVSDSRDQEREQRLKAVELAEQKNLLAIKEEGARKESDQRRILAEKLAEANKMLAKEEANARADADKRRREAEAAEKQRAKQLLRAESLLNIVHVTQANDYLQKFDLVGCRLALDETRWDLRGPEYGYLVKQLDKKARTLFGHTGAVNCLALAADGKRLFSGGGSKDGTIKVWDVETGKETLTMLGHTDGVFSLALSADGKHLFSGGGDKTIKVWDLESGKETLTLNGHTGSVLSLALAANGKRLFSGGGDRTIKVWDLESGKETLTLRGHPGPVFILALAADGKRLFSSGYDSSSTVKVWDLEAGKEILTLRGHRGTVRSLALSADGKRLFTGSASVQTPGEIKVWDLEAGKETLTLRGHTEWVTCLALSADSKRLFSGGGLQDGTIKVWDLETGKETLTMLGHTDGVFSLAVSADGKRLFSGGGDKTIKVWDLEAGKEARTLRGHTGTVRSLALAADGKRLFSYGVGFQHDTIQVWDLEAGKVALTLNTAPKLSGALAWRCRRTASGCSPTSAATASRCGTWRRARDPAPCAATRKGSHAWRCRRTASAWSRAAATGPSRCGTWRRTRKPSPCAATRSGSLAWRCRRTASDWSRAAATTPSRCGTWRRARKPSPFAATRARSGAWR